MIVLKEKEYIQVVPQFCSLHYWLAVLAWQIRTMHLSDPSLNHGMDARSEGVAATTCCLFSLVLNLKLKGKSHLVSFSISTSQINKCSKLSFVMNVRGIKNASKYQKIWTLLCFWHFLQTFLSCPLSGNKSWQLLVVAEPGGGTLTQMLTQTVSCLSFFTFVFLAQG